MGGKATKMVSASDYGRLELSFAQRYFLAGEAIQGKVLVTTNEEVAVRSLEVQLLGIEETSCYRTKQSVTIVDNKQVLIAGQEDTQSILVPPRQDFGFSLTTEGARALPSSCRYASSMLRCQVKYVVVAKLHVVGRRVSTLVARSEVQILAKLHANSNKVLIPIVEPIACATVMCVPCV